MTESKFILGDCMDIMKDYPDNYFDLAIVDPPYGIGISKHKNLGKRKNKRAFTNYKVSNWDSNVPDDEYFNELFRVSKNQIIWGANYFSLPPSRGYIFWDKKLSPAFSFSAGELAYTSFDCVLRKVSVSVSEWKNCISTSERHASGKTRIHPTQKPVALYRWLLTNYAKEGDLILDTHVGSASSLIACKELGFTYVGCEVDPDYYRDANKRLNIFESQLRIQFDAPKKQEAIQLKIV